MAENHSRKSFARGHTRFQSAVEVNKLVKTINQLATGRTREKVLQAEADKLNNDPMFMRWEFEVMLPEKTSAGPTRTEAWLVVRKLPGL